MRTLNVLFVLLFCTSAFIRAEDESDEYLEDETDSITTRAKGNLMSYLDKWCNQNCKTGQPLSAIRKRLCQSCYPVNSAPANGTTGTPGSGTTGTSENGATGTPGNTTPGPSGSGTNTPPSAAPTLLNATKMMSNGSTRHLIFKKNH